MPPLNSQEDKGDSSSKNRKVIQKASLTPSKTTPAQTPTTNKNTQYSRTYRAKRKAREKRVQESIIFETRYDEGKDLNESEDNNELIVVLEEDVDEEEQQIQVPPKKVQKKSLDDSKKHQKLLKTNSLMDEDSIYIDINTSVAVFSPDGILLCYGDLVEDENDSVEVGNYVNVKILEILDDRYDEYQLNSVYLIAKENLIRKHWIADDYFASAEEYLQSVKEHEERAARLLKKDCTGVDQEVTLQRLKQLEDINHELTAQNKALTKELSKLKRKLEVAEKYKPDPDVEELIRAVMDFVHAMDLKKRRANPSTIVEHDLVWEGEKQTIELTVREKNILECGKASKAIIPFLKLLDEHFQIIPSDDTYRIPFDRSKERSDRKPLSAMLYEQIKSAIKNQLNITTVESNFITKFLDAKYATEVAEEGAEEMEVDNQNTDDESQGFRLD